MEITKKYIDYAIARAIEGFPKVFPKIEGLSSDRIRRLLCWLCTIEDANYLEIGVFTGSTLIPALWNNKATASCIDNWSQYYIERSAFTDNLEKHLPGRDVNIIDGDLFEIDVDLIIPNVNVYFYDGDHSEEAHYQAFARYDPVFTDRFVALVDDWDSTNAIRGGTLRAFDDLGYRIEYGWQLHASGNDENSWWNGLYVVIINKEAQ